MTVFAGAKLSSTAVGQATSVVGVAVDSVDKALLYVTFGRCNSTIGAVTPTATATPDPTATPTPTATTASTASPDPTADPPTVHPLATVRPTTAAPTTATPDAASPATTGDPNAAPTAADGTTDAPADATAPARWWLPATWWTAAAHRRSRHGPGAPESAVKGPLPTADSTAKKPGPSEGAVVSASIGEALKVTHTHPPTQMSPTHTHTLRS